VIRPHRRTISQLTAPAAPPRLPPLRARVCAVFQALGELLHTSPPTAMAPPRAASRRGDFPLPPRSPFLQKRVRHFTVVRVRSLPRPLATGAGRSAIAAAATSRARTPTTRSAPRGGRTVPLGRAPSGPARWTSRARETGRENGHGPTVDLGPARFFFFQKNKFRFLLILLMKNTCKMIPWPF
jgi:hypothetical protein